jgi:hypothetical protein
MTLDMSEPQSGPATKGAPTHLPPWASAKSLPPLELDWHAASSAGR